MGDLLLTWPLLEPTNLLLAVFWVVPLWRLLDRAGYSGALALFGAVPVGAIILLWVLAFRTGPFLKEDARD